MFLRDRIRLPKLPLQWVLTIPFVVQTLGIVGLVGYLSYASGQRSVQKLAYQLMANVEQQVRRELNSYLQRAHEFNQVQLAAIASGTLDLNDLNQLHRYLNLQHRQADDLTTLLLGTPAGDFRVSHRISPRDYGSNTYLRSDEFPYEVSFSDSDEPSILYVHAVNAAGNPARRLDKLQKIDVRDRPWYRQAVETGQAGWTAPLQIGSTDVLALNAYAPLYDDANQLLSVFAVNISLEQLNQFLETLDIGVSGEAFIIDRDGLLIVESTPELPYRVSGRDSRTSADTAEPGLLTFERRSPADMANPLLQQSYQHLREIYGDFSTLQSLQQMEFMAQGNRYFLTISPYSDEYGLDWLVATIVPASDFMGEIQQNNRTTALLCLLALGGAIASGTVLSKQIARRFEQLNQAGQALAQGEFEQTLPTDSAIAEVQGLATAFNQVAAQLQQLFQQQVAVEATRQSEQQFQEIARTISQFFFVRSAKTQQFTYVSPAFETIWGHPCETLYENPDFWMAAIHPDDRPLVQASLAQQFSGQPVSREYRIVRPDGSLRWISTQVQLVRDEAGRPLRYIGTAADISDRKQAEASLQAKTEELDRFFSVALDLLCIADTEGTFLRLNPQWETTLGYSLAELGGSRIWDYVHPEDVDATLAVIAQLARQATVEGFVNRYRCRDGSYRWIEWRAVPVGALIYAAARDVTKRQQMEAAIQLSEARKQSILSAIPDLIFLLDRQGVYLEAIRSDGVVDVVAAATDPIGKHVSELVSPEIAHRHLQAIQQVVQTRHLVTFEQAIQVGDRTQYEEVTAVPCETDTVLFLVRDISEQKRLEADLRSLNAQLQELAAIDSLTQVANRRQMEWHLQQEWERCRRAKEAMTLVLLDIDHFKRYNDQYGHPQGDACLRQVADILQTHVNRPGDLASRYGGEEFLLVLPQTGQPGAVYLVEAIQQAFTQAQIPHAVSPTAQWVTVSMGVAVFMDVAGYSSSAEAIAVTDTLLYQAKQIRNTYCLRVL